MQSLIITLDGPAGSGKSTVARRLAARLGLEFLDTGAMYRGLTAACLDRGVDPGEQPELVIELAGRAQMFFDWRADPPRLHVRLGGGRPNQEIKKSGNHEIGIGEESGGGGGGGGGARTPSPQPFPAPGFGRGGESGGVTDRLRDPDVTQSVSDVASIPGVRQVLVREQQRIGREHPRLVTEGRDQGSVVFPGAAVKFYLDASPQVRGQRRAAELREAGKPADAVEILRQITARDHRDANRKDGPLVCPADAIRIDTSGMLLDEVVDRIERDVRERVGGLLGEGEQESAKAGKQERGRAGEQEIERRIPKEGEAEENSHPASGGPLPRKGEGTATVPEGLGDV